MTSRRVELLVGLRVCLLAGLQAMAALLSWSHSPAVLMVVALLGSALVILGWFAWRTGHGRGWVVVLFLASFASTGLDGGGSTVLILILGVGLLGYTLGTAWGLLGLAVMVCLIELTTYASGNLGGWGVVGVQLLAVTLMLSLGVLLGQLLRELDQERRRNAELLDEVRRAAVTEQELMLADERSRSARELHDGLGHQLTLVVLSLEFAERMRDKDPGRAFAEAADGHEALAVLRSTEVDVVLTDARMPGMDGVELVRQFTARHPGLPAVVLTTFDDEDIITGAMAAGAAGFLLKDVSTTRFAEPIAEVAAGGLVIDPRVARLALGRGAERTDPLAVLTRTERLVAEHVARGATNGEIAAAMHLPEGTVKNQSRRCCASWSSATAPVWR